MMRWLIQIEKENEMEDKIKVTERGWQGHFICDCRYHRNTLLEYKDKKVIVSTVGNYQYEDKITTIGLRRYYETMVWPGRQDGKYIDAYVYDGEVNFDSKWQITVEDFEIYEDELDNIADRMHEQVVKEIKGKLLSGEINA